MYKLYNVEYRNTDCLEYGRILLIMMDTGDCELSHEKVESWYATNIKILPLSLAKAIWPIFTEAKILSMFLIAAEEADIQLYDKELSSRYRGNCLHTVGVFEHSAIYESWMYPLIAQWNEDPEQYDSFIKERLFTVAINS